MTDSIITRLAPKRRERILDLGCGAGEHLEQMLRHASGVSVVGVDRWGGMLEKAESRLSRFIKRGRAELVAGDAAQPLPFESQTFDAVISVDLLECVPPKKRPALLREIQRVLKPGGRMFIEHIDWDTQVWNASDRALERALVHAFCDWTQGWMGASDGWMGRKLLGLVRGSGRFSKSEVSAHVLIEDRYKPGTYGHDRAQDLLSLAKATKTTRLADVRRFIRDLGKQHRSGNYFYSVTRYLVTASAKR